MGFCRVLGRGDGAYRGFLPPGKAKCGGGFLLRLPCTPEWAGRVSAVLRDKQIRERRWEEEKEKKRALLFGLCTHFVSSCLVSGCVYIIPTYPGKECPAGDGTCIIALFSPTGDPSSGRPIWGNTAERPGRPPSALFVVPFQMTVVPNSSSSNSHYGALDPWTPLWVWIPRSFWG